MRLAARRCQWFLGLAFAACSAAPPMPDPSPSDPASPAAAEAPRQAASDTLRLDGGKERR